MIEATKIREAVQALDPKDDSVWEADGTPKLDILKTLTGEPTLSIDDVQEAGDFKRGVKISAKAKPPAAAKKGEETSGEPEVDISTLDPQSPEYAAAVVVKARAEDSKLAKAIADQERTLEVCKTEIAKLTVLRDAQTVLIERYEPQISHAQAVKAIQRQTVETLKHTRERMAVAQHVLGPGGTAVTYPSPMDAMLASRKRSPEQAANYAKFVHQTAAASG